MTELADDHIGFAAARVRRNTTIATGALWQSLSTLKHVSLELWVLTNGENHVTDKILLLLAAIGLVPIALSYGLIPSVSLPYLLGFPVEGLHETHVFRAIMGLYLANVAFWVAGTMIGSLTRPALWSLLIFMGGLAAGRLVSVVVDGMPNFVLLFYLGAETAFAVLAAINLKKTTLE